MVLFKGRFHRQGKTYLPLTRLLAFTGLLALGCSSAFAVDPGAAGASVKQGGEIFQKRCFVCHNKKPNDTTPFGPPNLYAAFHGRPPFSAAKAETIITNGHGQMPAFKTVLTRSEIKSVIAFLRSDSLAKRTE